MWKLVAAFRSNPSNEIHGPRSISPRREIDGRFVSPIETNGTKEKSGNESLFFYTYIYISIVEAFFSIRMEVLSIYRRYFLANFGS